MDSRVQAPLSKSRDSLEEIIIAFFARLNPNATVAIRKPQTSEQVIRDLEPQTADSNSDEAEDLSFGDDDGFSIAVLLFTIKGQWTDICVRPKILRSYNMKLEIREEELKQAITIVCRNSPSRLSLCVERITYEPGFDSVKMRQSMYALKQIQDTEGDSSEDTDDTKSPEDKKISTLRRQKKEKKAEKAKVKAQEGIKKTSKDKKKHESGKNKYDILQAQATKEVAPVIPGTKASGDEEASVDDSVELEQKSEAGKSEGVASETAAVLATANSQAAEDSSDEEENSLVANLNAIKNRKQKERKKRRKARKGRG